MDEITLRLVRKAETQEWVVRCYVNGVYSEEKSYYTDCKDDAVSTAAHSVEWYVQCGHPVTLHQPGKAARRFNYLFNPRREA